MSDEIPFPNGCVLCVFGAPDDPGVTARLARFAQDRDLPLVIQDTTEVPMPRDDEAVLTIFRGDQFETFLIPLDNADMRHSLDGLIEALRDLESFHTKENK